MNQNLYYAVQNEENSFKIMKKYKNMLNKMFSFYSEVLL